MYMPVALILIATPLGAGIHLDALYCSIPNVWTWNYRVNATVTVMALTVSISFSSYGNSHILVFYTVLTDTIPGVSMTMVL